MAGRCYAGPSIEIRLRLEEAPQVRYFAATFDDAERLRLWLERRPGLLDALRRLAPDGVIEGPPGAEDWHVEETLS